ncbi:NDR1/HIN1-like protein 13 [Phalaenopsis equestris]|uniref:NDR1/HIN1-like protein 13 n=1 Tax=Phalaenopsis equestris TaxID=78828 RepID=UPI0009E1EC06|nr:NDR1/HIN1-like protein 13 [Phalaenopsis equestris]
MAKNEALSPNPTTSHFQLLCSAFSTLLILAGITALVLYLIYRPSRPHFTVLGAAIYHLNKTTLAAPAIAISSSMQFTVAIHNPNSRASVQLDKLCAYLSYRDEPITPSSSLPSLYEEAGGTVVVSPVFGADIVPVSAEVEGELMNDESYGVVALQLVIMGRVSYRPGPFRSGLVGLYVKCDVLVGLKKGTAGQVPLLAQPYCIVHA